MAVEDYTVSSFARTGLLQELGQNKHHMLGTLSHLSMPLSSLYKICSNFSYILLY